MLLDNAERSPHYADLLRLEQQRSEMEEKAVQDAAAAAAAHDAAAVAPGGDVQAQEVSWVRNFFELDDHGQQRCLLQPLFDEASRQAKPHKQLVSNELSSMRKHIVDSNFHASAYNFYTNLTQQGQSPASAADATIEWVNGQHEKRVKSFGIATTKAAKHTPTEEERDFHRNVALAVWLAVKCVSFRAIEGDEFEEYHNAYGWKHPPNRRFISGEFLQQVCKLAEQHQATTLADVDFFCVTTDAATLSHDKDNHYIAVTAHAVTPDFALRAFLLGFFALNKSHNWIHLTESLTNVIQTAFPSDAATLTTIVTDQGANFNKAAMSVMTNLDVAQIDGLGPDDWDEPLPSRLAVDIDVTLHHLCVDHRMQNAALDVAKIPAPANRPSPLALIDKARVLVVHIRGSQALTTTLESIQTARLLRTYPLPEDAKRRHPLSLQLDVVTRWLSLHEMLRRFLELYDDILVLALRGLLNGGPPMVTLDEKDELTHVAKAFEPLADFVRWAEGDQYVTSSLVPVMLARCLDALQPAANDSSRVQQLKSALKTSINARLGQILTEPNLCLAAAALDPNYGHLSFIAADVRDRVWDDLAQWAVEWPMSRKSATANFGGVPLPNADDNIELGEYKSLLSKVRRVFEEQKPAHPLELKSKENCVNALEYWRATHDNGGGMRRITHLARIVFAVPATSAPSEREFSAANLIVTALRAGLDSETVIALVKLRGHVRRVGVKNFIEFCLDWFRKNGKKRKAV